MRICNLAGVYTGEGFLKTQGRRPLFEGADHRTGPLDIIIDEQGRIAGIEPTRALTSREAAIDGSGLVATAGFVDGHTHALFAGDRSFEYFMRWRGASYREISDRGGGIKNTMRDVSGLGPLALEEKFEHTLGELRSTGTTSVEVKTGYAPDAQGELALLRLLKKYRPERAGLPSVRASFLGLHALPKGRVERDFVDEMISILPVVQAEGLADYVDAFPEQGFFTLEESLRFVRAAQAVGLKAKIHADEMSDMDAAAAFAALNALSVDHLQKISARGVAALAASDTVALMLPATSFYVGLEYTNARQLIDANVRVGLASDFNPGTAPSSSLLFTALLAATQMRLSSPEILCGLTVNGAASMGLADRGTLTPGARADILLWGCDARKGEDALDEIFVRSRAPRKVIIGGRPTEAFNRL